MLMFKEHIAKTLPHYLTEKLSDLTKLMKKLDTLADHPMELTEMEKLLHPVFEYFACFQNDLAALNKMGVLQTVNELFEMEEKWRSDNGLGAKKTLQEWLDSKIAHFKSLCSEMVPGTPIQEMVDAIQRAETRKQKGVTSDYISLIEKFNYIIQDIKSGNAVIRVKETAPECTFTNRIFDWFKKLRK